MITINERQLARAEEVLRRIPNGAPIAIANVLNRAAEGARAAAVRKVRERYLIRAKDVNATIRITKAKPDRLVAVVYAAGSPIVLSKFKVTPSQPVARQKKPVVARVTRGGGGPIRGAFLARVQSGHIGVFRRAGRSRLPIKQLYGPSVPQMLGHESVTSFVAERAGELMESRMEHEMQRLLRGVGR